MTAQEQPVLAMEREDGILRQPCFQCGEPTPVSGRICAHCHSSLLVDLQVATIVADPRTIYHAARSLANLGPEAPRFEEAKGRLEAAPGVVATGMTRAQAAAAAAALEPFGIEATGVAATGEAGASPSGFAHSLSNAVRRSPLLLAAIALVVVITAVIILRGSDAELPSSAVASDRTGHVPAGTTALATTTAVALSTRDLAARATQSTVQLLCENTQGAGFFVEPDVLVTNAHVLCPGSRTITVVLDDGHRLVGQVTRADEWLDVARVQVPGAGAVPLPLGDAGRLQQGDRVMTIGNPEGLDFSVAEGIISHTARIMMGISYLQLDASVHHGNSGGPVLDAAGQVVGVVSMMVGSSSRLGLALPVNYLYYGHDRILWEGDIDYDEQRWRSLLQAAGDAEREELAEVRQTLDKPGLVSAWVTQPGLFRAFVIRYRQWSPQAEGFNFEIRQAEQLLCSPRGDVERWYNLSGVETLDSRFVMWLERNHLLGTVFVGVAKVRMGGCPEPRQVVGAELQLVNGDPRSDTATIDYLPGHQYQGMMLDLERGSVEVIR